MKNVTKIFVGVDVSKDTLAVHILPLAESFVLDNDAKGMKKLIAILAPHEVEQIVCEATGGYETRMLKALKKSGYKTWLVEPKRIKSFIHSLGIRAKTDKIDAQKIALFASRMVQDHEQNYEHNQGLRLLVNRKKDLTDMLIQEKVRLQHPNENYKKDIKLHITFLKKQITSLEKKISEVIDNDASLSVRVRIIESIPGFGRRSAAIIVAELPELGHVNNSKISSLLGVAPHPYESGKFKGKRITTGGRPYPRSTMFMIALVASRCNATFKEFYQRLLNAGKSKKLALVALSRKIITVVNTMLKNGTLWNENMI